MDCDYYYFKVNNYMHMVYFRRQPKMADLSLYAVMQAQSKCYW